jgi:hypothetical protein
MRKQPLPNIQFQLIDTNRKYKIINGDKIPLTNEMIIILKSRTIKFEVEKCSLTTLDNNLNEIEDETIDLFHRG